MLDQRCALCHNAQVQQKNVALHTPELIKQHAQNVYQQAVVLKLMPMNNATQITDDERDADQALVRSRRAVELSLPAARHGPSRRTPMTAVTTVHPVDEKLPARPRHRAGPAACAGDVRRRHRRAADRRPRAQAHARAGGAADQRRPVRLRHRHADPVPGHDALLRHQAAGDDGRDLRRGRPDGGLRQRRCRASKARARSSAPSSARASSRCSSRRSISQLLRFFPPVVTGTIITIIGISLMRVGVGWAMGGPAFLAQRTDVPKLVEMVDKAKASGGGRVGAGHARADPDGRQPGLRRAGQHGHRRLRAGDRAAAGEVRQGLRRQHLGAAGHRRRLRAGHRAWAR